MVSHRKTARIVQIALGFALSGGAALFLSGSAMAADPSAAFPVINPASGLRIASEFGAMVPSTDTNLSISNTVISQITSSNLAAISPTPAGSDQPPTVLSASSSRISGVLTIDSTAGNSTGAASSSFTAANPDAPGASPSSTNANPADSQSSAAAASSSSATRITTSSATARTTTPGGRASYRSLALPIRSTITASSDLPAGLTVDPPGAASHNPSPSSPAKSSGLLQAFTVQLAGIVVPSLVSLVSFARPFATTLNLLALTLLLGAWLVASYALRLRRSGHAHAARSDLPASLSFATPHLLSYVSSRVDSPHIAHFLWRQRLIKDQSMPKLKGGDYMMIQRLAASASMAALAAVTLSTPALADTVTISGTGAGSSNTVAIDNTNTTTTTNTNTVTVTTTNVQTATSGNVSASGNTSLSGGLSSGAASNQSTQTTTVTIGHQPTGGQGAGSGSGPGGQGGITGGQTPGGNTGTTPPASGHGGSVLGASTVAPTASAVVTTLPVTGASVPVDVSALRALYHSQAAAPTTQLAKRTAGISTLFLLVASALSLVGAAGSAVYAVRKQQPKA